MTDEQKIGIHIPVQTRRRLVVDRGWPWPRNPMSEDPSTPMRRRPEIVTLCGSTRFVDAFNEWRRKLTLEGRIVLTIEIVTTQTAEEDPQHTDPDTKAMLDDLHLYKISMSDRIMVLNVGGYIGESTKREIAYAYARHIPITYLEDK